MWILILAVLVLLYALLPIKIKFELGCIGVVWRGHYQGDMFFRPYWGIYRNDGYSKRWYKLPTFRLLKSKFD